MLEVLCFLKARYFKDSENDVLSFEGSAQVNFCKQLKF